MLFEAIAILLKREQLNTYDEKLIFFTQRMGKVLLYSYGSRSLRSARRSALRKPAWLRITIEKSKNYLTLRDAFTVKPIIIPEKRTEIRLFQGFLKWVMYFAPFQSSDSDLYSLLELLTLPRLVRTHLSFREVLYPASLLKISGELPSFEHCVLCDKRCAETYTPTSEGTFVGISCVAAIPSHLKLLSSFTLTLAELVFLQRLNSLFPPYLEEMLIDLERSYLNEEGHFQQGAAYLRELVSHRRAP